MKFSYDSAEYSFRFFNASLNQKKAVEILFEFIDSQESLFNKDEAPQLKLLLEFYWKFRDSPELKTKIKQRFLRKGVRKFDVRTLAPSNQFSEGGKAFIGHITFSQLPLNEKDAQKRFETLLETIKKQKGNSIENPNELFKNAIYIPEVYNIENNEQEYENFASEFYKKLISWEQIENGLLDEILGRANMDQSASEIISDNINQIKDFQRQFTSYFSNDMDNPSFRRLFFQLEAFFYSCWETIFMIFYYSIENNLTEIEKNAFQLAYMRQEYIDYHIPMFEPILVEFLRILTKQEKDEMFYCLLVDESEDKKTISKYDKKFNEFLNFYPIWLDIIRLDESLSPEDLGVIGFNNLISRRRQTGISHGEKDYTKFDSINDPISRGNENNRGQTFEDILTREDNIESTFDLEKYKLIIENNLSDKQKEVVKLKYQDEDESLTEEEIANKLGISQPAVNQRLQGALKIIRDKMKAS